MKDARTIDVNETARTIDEIFRLWQSRYCTMDDEKILSEVQLHYGLGSNEYELVRRVLSSLRTMGATLGDGPTMDNASLYAAPKAAIGTQVGGGSR